MEPAPTKTEILVNAIAALQAELPTLFGDAWAEVEPELLRLVQQLVTDPDNANINRAHIRDLFLAHPAADRRLVDTMNAIKGDTAYHIRGIPNILARFRPPVARFVDIACPPRVWKNTRLVVKVQLLVKPAAHSATDVQLHRISGSPIQVILVASPDFECLGPEQLTITMPYDGDSSPALFELRPREVGSGLLTFLFLQGEMLLGKASVKVEIVENEPSGARPVTYAPRPSAAVAPSLRIRPDEWQMPPSERERFRTLLTTGLDLSEVRAICHDLGIDHQDLVDTNKGVKIMELIDYLQRRERLGECYGWLGRHRVEILNALLMDEGRVGNR
jgi:hypothetical protein